MFKWGSTGRFRQETASIRDQQVGGGGRWQEEQEGIATLLPTMGVTRMFKVLRRVGTSQG
jgi:hypothetical protein